MDQFLENCKQLKLTQDDTGNLNSSIIILENEFTVKMLPQKKSPDPRMLH